MLDCKISIEVHTVFVDSEEKMTALKVYDDVAEQTKLETDLLTSFAKTYDCESTTIASTSVQVSMFSP